jgi:hypothetical protein
MRLNTIFSTIFLVTVLPVAQISIADDAAVGEMAKIMISLKHFPSDSDKETLSAITNSSDNSEAEIAIATAITNIKHQASDADKEKLNAIVADESSPAEVRNLATVVLNTNHEPSASDIAKLEEIASAN